MIGCCNHCERENVPITKLYCDGVKIFVCFLCQGEYDPDPYGEIEGSIPWNEANGQFGVGA